MASEKALELRALLGLAIQLRKYAENLDDLGDTELFVAVALALEQRANRLAFGAAPVPQPPVKVDVFC